jgi:hypothetical protein
MKRIKCKELSFQILDAWTVTQYRVTSKDGNNYYVYAKRFGDLEYLVPKLDIATRSRDCEDHFEERKCWTCMCKNDNPIRKPFWYYGRVYLETK